jgi:type IV pilus assembly protein PilM
MRLFESTNEGLGLDIGTNNIKAVWLKKSRGLIRLMAYNNLPIDPLTFGKNSIIKKDALVKAIQELLSTSKLRPINITKVNCALPETMTFVKTMLIPEMPEEELEKAISWDIKQFIPLPIEKVYWDWQIVKKEKNKQEIFLAVALKQIVDDFYSVISQSGLEMNALEVEPLVLSRALINKQNYQKNIFIVDIGSQTTNFSIFENGVIKFTHNTLFGGSAQTETIAKSLKLKADQAENIKKTLNSDGPLQNKAKKSITSLLNNLADEIKRSIGFCEEHEKRKIDLIILCGGGANLAGIDKYLSKVLSYEVKIGNPWINVTTYPLKAVPKDEIPIYAQAIGSALRDIKKF